MYVEGEGEIPAFLPLNVALGGHIFLCNQKSLPRITELMIFGFPDSYGGNPDAYPEYPLPNTFRDRVRAITTGLPLFLYNLTTRCLHGIYEAADNGSYNIEPGFFPCFDDMRRSSFPFQVRVRLMTEYQPLDEQMTAGIMDNLRIAGNNFYRYRVELTAPEAANIINVFTRNGVAVV